MICKNLDCLIALQNIKCNENQDWKKSIGEDEDLFYVCGEDGEGCGEVLNVDHTFKCNDNAKVGDHITNVNHHHFGLCDSPESKDDEILREITNSNKESH